MKSALPSIRCVVTALASAAVAASVASAQVSTRPGVGAIPYQGGAGNYGVTFRTWAPNASSVFVAGSFNNWSTTATALSSEGNGWWSRDVGLVPTGAQYKFVVKRGTTSYWRNDPRARRMTNSVGNSIVYSPSSYQWPLMHSGGNSPGTLTAEISAEWSSSRTRRSATSTMASICPSSAATS